MCATFVALGNSTAERAAFSARCFAQAGEATARWTERVRAAEKKHRLPLHYSFAWSGFNRRAKF